MYCPVPTRSGLHPQALCGIREYSLTLDAPSIDTTIVGEKFGEAVKSLVSGGGSFEFFIDRTCLGDDTEDASWMMMNLLFNTEGGCSGAPIETEAWFNVMEGNGCDELLPTNRRSAVLQSKHPDYTDRSKCPPDGAGGRHC